MTSFSRRRIVGGAGAVLGATALGASITGSAAAATRGTANSAFRPGRQVREEEKSLDELYADARREGGELVIYAGGDLPDQQDATKQAFVSQFPDIKLNMVVDYSKYQDVRIDNQLATGTLVPDVVQLQTVQDFARWKAMGVLQRYKPGGFSALYPQFRDPDGAWVSIAVFAFSYMYNQALGSDGPATPRDLADPGGGVPSPPATRMTTTRSCTCTSSTRRRTAGTGCVDSPRRTSSSAAAASPR